MTHRTAAVQAAEHSLTQSLTAELRTIGAALAERVSAAAKVVAHDLTDDAVDEADWEPIVDTVSLQLVAVAEDGARNTLLDLGISAKDTTDQTFQEAVEWAKRRAAELVGKQWDDDGNLVDNADAEMAITDTVRAEIRTAVRDALDRGAPAADLADDIAGIDAFSPDRAMTIARTEVIRAHGQGQLAAFRNSGVVEQKAWSTAEDGDTCDDCTENEDEGAIDLDDDFPSGDDAPPGHPNCRCALVAVMADEDEDEEEDEDNADDEESADEEG